MVRKKIKTFIWDAVNNWDDFDARVNAFLQDKSHYVIDLKVADSQDDEHGFYHTVTVYYEDYSEDLS